MKDYSNDFGPFDSKVWLNTASEGAIPKVSAQAAQEAIEWKLKPYNLTFKRFGEVPRELKKAIGRLMNVEAKDVIIGNSATYGIHLFANGLPLEQGDEVLLMQNDFPSDILPWLGLQEKGVVVKQIKPKSYVLQPDEIKENISSSTKVICLSHVHSFTGHIIDIPQIGKLCKENGIIFIANLSQSLGNRPVDVTKLNVDAITTAAFKWLCGPYGTGFCWTTPQLRKKLHYNQAYWGNALSPEQLADDGPLELNDKDNPRKYDVFGTANFFNFKPLTASIEYLLNIGMEAIYEHNDTLVEKVINELDSKRYDLISPSQKEKRSNLVVFSHKDKAKNKAIFDSLVKDEIYPALWKGNLRIAPHIFNTENDIARAVEALNSI